MNKTKNQERIEMKREEVIKKITKVCKLVLFVFAFTVMLTLVSNTTVEAAKKPARVKGLKITSVKSNSVTLKWKKAKRAYGYKIYRKETSYKKYKHIATVYKKTSYKDSHLEEGTSYSYKVKAINAKNKAGKYSKAKKIKTKAYKKIYDMDMFDNSWAIKRSYVETTFGDKWYDSVELQVPYYESISEGYAEYYTNGKYNWFSGEIGLHSFAGEHPDYVIKIYGDGKLLYSSISMNKKTPYQKFKVNISGCKFIKISTARTTYWGAALIHNGVFYSN